jgi:hypothetical protein
LGSRREEGGGEKRPPTRRAAGGEKKTPSAPRARNPHPTLKERFEEVGGGEFSSTYISIAGFFFFLRGVWEE